jgi:hypothetical protein
MHQFLPVEERTAFGVLSPRTAKHGRRISCVDFEAPDGLRWAVTERAMERHCRAKSLEMIGAARVEGSGPHPYVAVMVQVFVPVSDSEAKNPLQRPDTDVRLMLLNADTGELAAAHRFPREWGPVMVSFQAGIACCCVQTTKIVELTPSTVVMDGENTLDILDLGTGKVRKVNLGTRFIRPHVAGIALTQANLFGEFHKKTRNHP